MTIPRKDFKTCWIIALLWKILVPKTPSESEIATYLSSRINCTLIEIQERQFNCFAYAFLYLDSKNWSYRRSVVITDVSAFTEDSAYKNLAKAGGLLIM